MANDLVGFLKAVPQLDVAYVPIGLGSGACAAIAAKLALGHKARIVGVVSRHATTYADSLAAGRVVEAPVSAQIADGMAVRRADAAALTAMAGRLDHLVQVSDDEVAPCAPSPTRTTPPRAAARLAAALQERAAAHARAMRRHRADGCERRCVVVC